jgi:hypothetical protein
VPARTGRAVVAGCQVEARRSCWNAGSQRGQVRQKPLGAALFLDSR